MARRRLGEMALGRKRWAFLSAGAALLMIAGFGFSWRSRVEQKAATAGTPTLVATDAQQARAAAVMSFRLRRAAEGHVVFRSHDGRAIRKDDDYELIFHRDPGRLDLLYFGYGLELFRGTYSLAPDGNVTIDLSGEQAPRLPPLALQQKNGALFLIPASSADTLDACSSEDDTWCFRMLTGSDETRCLEDLRETQQHRFGGPTIQK